MGNRDLGARTGDGTMAALRTAGGIGAVERYRGVAVAPRVAFGHLFLRRVLDTQNGGEGYREPALRDCSRETMAIRRIREADVERMRLQLLNEPQRIRTVNAELVPRAEQFGVRPDRADAHRAHLDQVRRRRTARQRLEA